MFEIVDKIKEHETYKDLLKSTGALDLELKAELLTCILEQNELIEKYKLRDVDILPIRIMRSQAFVFISLLSLIILTLYIAHNNLISTGIPESITYIAITTLELCSLTFLANNKRHANSIFIILTLISSGLYYKAWEFTGVECVIRSFYTLTPSLAMFFLSKLIFEKYDRDSINNIQ